MKPLKRFLMLAPLALLLVGGCKDAPTGGAGGTGNAQTTSGDTILIGHYAAMTGETSTFGVESDRGIQFAVEEINAAGGINGKKIQVETQDDQSKPEEAVTVVTKFAQNKDIVAVIGEVASTRSKMAAPVLQDAKIPMISPSSTNPEVTLVGDYIFRTCFIDPFQGYVMAKFTKENLKIDKVAVMEDQKNDYSKGLAKVFREEFEKMGGKIVGNASYKEGDSDFRSQLTEIKKASPGAIFIPGYYGEVGTIARQARELGLTMPLLGGDGWDSPKLVEGAGGAGKALEGAYFSNHYSKDADNPRVKAFVKAFQDKTGEPPSGLAAQSYDTIKLVADAIKRAGSTDRAAVRDALAKTVNFPGVTGDITIDKNRNAQKAAVVLQIKGNEFAYKTTVAPVSGK